VSGILLPESVFAKAGRSLYNIDRQHVCCKDRAGGCADKAEDFFIQH
jgi:hypothetical protein